MTPTLGDQLGAWLPAARRRVGELPVQPRLEEVGTVSHVGDGIALVTGLPDAALDELLQFANGTFGLVISLERTHAGCVLLGSQEGIDAGSRVHGTGRVASAPVGPGLLGRVVDPIGEPLDGGPAVTAERFDPVERPAPAILDRDLVSRPLQTGILVVDAMIPLGRGQRELIIGDRQTGKTALALDAILNQKESDVICVYAAIGQKSASVSAVIDAMQRYGAMDRSIVVVGEANALPGLQWLTPYSACTMAEYFRDKGRDVLLVLDDLSKHAVVYRQLSLLLRNPPGREAYPGDIFYIHSRLLERAAQLSPDRGGGSMTALPIAETQAEDLSAYIPTNLISITDGQVYLEPRLFYEGQKPAVNVGKSVSRVGGKAQAPVMQEIAESLRLEYSQFLELEVFTRFGGLVDERTRRVIDHGRRIRALLTQPQFDPLPAGEEAALLLALKERVLDEVPLERIGAFRTGARQRLREAASNALAAVERTGQLTPDDREALLAALRAAADAAKTGSPEPPAADTGEAE